MHYKEISMKLNKDIVVLRRLKRLHLRHLGNFHHGRQPTHGNARIGRRLRLYNIWGNIKQRCYNKKNKDYRRYGLRGIDICSEWHNYIHFKRWSLANGYLDNLEIDRINNDIGYSPENCQWITRAENTAKSNRLRRKLSNKDVIKLKHLYTVKNFSQYKLAKIFNLSQSNISNILSGKTYTDIS